MPRPVALLFLLTAVSACARSDAHADADAVSRASTASAAYAVNAVDAARPPNEYGRIPVVEYHLIGDTNTTYVREWRRFRDDLELLHARGYRPVSISDVVDRNLDLPRGLSPVVVVFDDASPSQFRYVEQPDGSLVIDSTSAVGVWLDFRRTHPGWDNRAVFCLLSGAEAGRSFFGDKGIDGQRTEWRFLKVRFLAEQGFELCNHTLWHARLDRYADSVVQEQIARLQLAVDSAAPGYRIRTLALPLGKWPQNRTLAQRGAWREPRSGRMVEYHHDAVLEVAGGPTRGPHDPSFNPLSILRVQAIGDDIARSLDALERSGTRYVSDGNAGTVAGAPTIPQVAAAPH